MPVNIVEITHVKPCQIYTLQEELDLMLSDYTLCYIVRMSVTESPCVVTLASSKENGDEICDFSV